jgi:hypothetical protein
MTTGMKRLRAWEPGLLLASACLFVGGAAAQTVEVEGVRLNSTAVVDDQRLQLNGAGFAKRGYYKVYVTSIYLPQKKDSLDAIAKLPGPKRLQLNIIKELSGATISRYFINDFRLAATDAEFRTLIGEMTTVGAVYGTLSKVSEGDVFAIDFIPGKGATVQRNGTAIVQGDFKPYLNTPGTELMFQILLRMYAGKDQPEELQKNLMGLSSSMQTVVTAAEAPARPVRKEPAAPSATPPSASASAALAVPPAAVTPAPTAAAGTSPAATAPPLPPAAPPNPSTAVAPAAPSTSAATEPVRRTPAAAKPVSPASSAPRQPRVWNGTRWVRPSELGSSSPQRIGPRALPSAPTAAASAAAAASAPP